MNKYRLSVFTLSFFIVSCMTGGRQPDWISGDTKQYSQALFLTATGSAAKPEDAKQRALANLTKIFEVKVEETSRDESSAWRETKESAATTGSSALSVRYIDAYSIKLLEGAEIAETWHDEKQSLYFALAVISRVQLGTKLRGDISSADHYINIRLANAAALQDSILKAQVLYSARTAARARAMLQRDLQIVDRTGAGIPAPISTKMLDAQIDAALAKIKVKQSVLQDEFGILDGILQSAVTAAGMQYSMELAEYELQGKLDIQDVGWKDGWYWYRGVLQLSLIQLSSEKVSASMQWPLKSSGQSKQQSRIRLEEEIFQLLNNQFKSALLFFGNKSSGHEKQ